MLLVDEQRAVCKRLMTSACNLLLPVVASNHPHFQTGRRRVGVFVVPVWLAELQCRWERPVSSPLVRAWGTTWPSVSLAQREVQLVAARAPGLARHPRCWLAGRRRGLPCKATSPPARSLRLRWGCGEASRSEEAGSVNSRTGPLIRDRTCSSSGSS